jgi:hypothetical protein
MYTCAVQDLQMLNLISAHRNFLVPKYNLLDIVYLHLA